MFFMCQDAQKAVEIRHKTPVDEEAHKVAVARDAAVATWIQVKDSLSEQSTEL
jgi:hypothetical protein